LLVVSEKFKIDRGKEKVILDDIPKWRKLDEKFGCKWIGCFMTYIGRTYEFEILYEIPDLATFQTMIEKTPEMLPNEFKKFTEFTSDFTVQILKLIH